MEEFSWVLILSFPFFSFFLSLSSSTSISCFSEGIIGRIRKKPVHNQFGQQKVIYAATKPPADQTGTESNRALLATILKLPKTSLDLWQLFPEQWFSGIGGRHKSKTEPARLLYEPKKAFSPGIRPRCLHDYCLITACSAVYFRVRPTFAGLKTCSQFSDFPMANVVVADLVNRSPLHRSGIGKHSIDIRPAI